ncbi:recombination endonuclease VII [Pseudomonas phage vB_PF_Y1-MI]|nr:recombination endonuclease VII [Pseudomonas phage vB_PF_Y1-MI]
MSFAVDHCHKTGKTRSLLCNLCNRALGFLQDDPEIVKAAWVYLEAHKAGCH